MILMSAGNGMMVNGSINRMGDGEMVVPSQSLTVAESSRTLAEVQAALTVAAARPRDERRCIERMRTACQRPRLAETAVYDYSRGGSAITGASIRLMEVIATNWGNITWGFREMAQGNGESTVEAYAWDLESNAKRAVSFVVPHRMKAGNSIKTLTDPRDIYEYIANQSQRRVRTCLENVIPRDIVEDMVDECAKTTKANVEVTPDSIKKMADAFENSFGVKPEQLAIKLGRNLDSMTPAQFLQMRRIFNSIKDGMSDVLTWFKPLEVDAAGKPSSLVEKLKDGLSNAKPSMTKATKKDPAPAPTQSRSPDGSDDDGISPGFRHYSEKIKAEKRVGLLSSMRSTIEGDADLEPSEKLDLIELVDERLAMTEGGA